MHTEINEGLKDDNTNIPIAKWILVKTIMWMDITINTCKHNFLAIAWLIC